MIIATGISLWRYLAQSQVDSQTHAERRLIFIYSIVEASPFKLHYVRPLLGFDMLTPEHVTRQIRLLGKDYDGA